MGECELMTFARYADHDVEGCEAETDEQTLPAATAATAGTAGSCRSGSTWPPSRPWPPRWPPSDFPTRARLLSRKHTEGKTPKDEETKNCLMSSNALLGSS